MIPIQGWRLRGLPVWAAAIAALFIAVTLGIAIGSVPIHPVSVWEIIIGRFTGQHEPSAHDQIVWNLRFPRVILAAASGSVLAIAGAVMQILVRNPLADPFLLGVSSGASVGATAVLLFGAFGSIGLWALSAGAGIGALIATAAVYMVAKSGAELAPTQLILTGVVLSALFSSITSFLIFKGDPNATQGVLFWLLGSFGRATWDQVVVPLIALAVGIAYLAPRRHLLNALAMGDHTARSLGVDVLRLRRMLYILASLLAASTVAVAGVIGFVGLVVPHIARLLVGANHERMLPLSALVGATFMVLADLLARTLASPQEMPLGVISAVIGAPTLLVLLRRGAAKRGAQ